MPRDIKQRELPIFSNRRAGRIRFEDDAVVGPDGARVRVWYDYRNDYGEQVTIYEEDYGVALAAIFPDEYENRSDYARDYYTKGQVKLTPGHPLFKQAKAHALRLRAPNPAKSNAAYLSNADAAHLFGVSPEDLGATVRVGQKVVLRGVWPESRKNYTRTVTKVTKRYFTLTDDTRFRRDTLEEDTSGSTWQIPSCEIVSIGGIRVE